MIDSEEIQDLYRCAFRDFGAIALWNMRPVERPTAGDAMAITKALRTHGRMDGRRLAERIEAAAMADAAALTAAGCTIAWDRVRPGRREATVARGGEVMRLEWATDATFRFFPTQPDELFGYVLHPVDLATKKAAAAADRREPRDIVDLVTIHETILPLGAVMCAAVGKFPGETPEEMLAEITRHGRFTAEEFQALATEGPIDMPRLHRRIRSMIEDAEKFIASLPCDAVGVVFMDGDKAVQPDLNALDRYRRNPGAPRGYWPSSPEIAHAMLER